MDRWILSCLRRVLRGVGALSDWFLTDPPLYASKVSGTAFGIGRKETNPYERAHAFHNA